MRDGKREHARSGQRWTPEPADRSGHTARTAPTTLALTLALTLAPAVGGAPGRSPLTPLAGAHAASLETTLTLVDFQVGDEPFPKARAYCSRVEQELEGARSFAVLSSADAARALAPSTRQLAPVDPSTLAELRARLGEVEDLIYSHPRRAIKRISSLAERLDEALAGAVPDSQARALYFDLHIKLARAYSDLGEDKKTRNVMRKMLAFLGDAEVTEEHYHPKVVALWREAEAEAEAARAPHASLRVSSTPPGLPVLINGRPLDGVTPVMLGALPPGPAVVTVRSQAGAVSREVTLTAGETTALKVDVDRALALTVHEGRVALRFPTPESYHKRAADLAADVGRRLHVDRVLLCGLVRKDAGVFLTGLLVDTATGRVSQRKELYTKANVVSRNRVRQLAGFFQGVFVETQLKPWYTSWVGWTGVGLTAAGAAAGVILWGQFESLLAEIQCTKGPPECKTEAERAALAGDATTYRALGGTGFVLAGLGVAAAVVGFVWVRDEELAEEPDEAATSGVRLRALSPTLLPGGTPGVSGLITF